MYFTLQLDLLEFHIVQTLTCWYITNNRSENYMASLYRSVSRYSLYALQCIMYAKSLYSVNPFFRIIFRKRQTTTCTTVDDCTCTGAHEIASCDNGNCHCHVDGQHNNEGNHHPPHHPWVDLYRFSTRYLLSYSFYYEHFFPSTRYKKQKYIHICTVLKTGKISLVLILLHVSLLFGIKLWIRDRNFCSNT